MRRLLFLLVFTIGCASPTVPTPVPVPSVPVVEVPPAPTPTLIGLVFDGDTGALLSDVRVDVDEQPVTTTAAGRFELTLGPGRYLLTFTKDGYGVGQGHASISDPPTPSRMFVWLYRPRPLSNQRLIEGRHGE